MNCLTVKRNYLSGLLSNELFYLTVPPYKNLTKAEHPGCYFWMEQKKTVAAELKFNHTGSTQNNQKI